MQIPLKTMLYANQLISLLTTNRCPICKRSALSYPNQLICYKCKPSMDLKKVCLQCGKLVELNSTEIVYDCRYCRTFKLHYQQARSLALYEGSWRDTIKIFKLQPGGVLLNQLAGMMRRFLMTSHYFFEINWIVPVPQRRRFLGICNQHPASQLAKKLSQKTGIAYQQLLSFKGQTRKQHQLTRNERLKNMNNAMVCPKKLNPNDCFLIIDDVFTTGATVNECARALQKAGSMKIYVLTLARGRDKYNYDD